MSKMELVIDADRLMQAILQQPQKLQKNLDHAITRVLYTFARAARDKAPKAFSTLTNSIGITREGPLSGAVGPAVDYGAAVELGTGVYGPGGSASGRMPPVQNIRDWIDRLHIGSVNYADPNDLAWAIAKSIARGGTPPQPYMAPAFEENKERAERLIDVAIAASLGAAA